MDLRTQFEKETGHNRVGIELAATETSAYIRWLESQYQSQSTRIRELEGDKLKDLNFLKELEAHMEKWENDRDVVSRDYAFQMVGNWIDEIQKALNKKGAVRRKRNQGRSDGPDNV